MVSAVIGKQAILQPFQLISKKLVNNFIEIPATLNHFLTKSFQLALMIIFGPISTVIDGNTYKSFAKLIV